MALTSTVRWSDVQQGRLEALAAVRGVSVGRLVKALVLEALEAPGRPPGPAGEGSLGGGAHDSGGAGLGVLGEGRPVESAGSGVPVPPAGSGGGGLVPAGSSPPVFFSVVMERMVERFGARRDLDVLVVREIRAGKWGIERKAVLDPDVVVPEGAEVARMA